ncbi:DUF7373 family lipoprotein [Nocardia amikacinitolerans]|uniref:DUF7373 family lipoprotein n=1 Tax=Nocardia amikacinitolerans TaxID=756689 RepID=UPI0020A560D7|nr:hypothetical protein [Nocardia amikacinitolerans]MCP2277093.1 hypothetical protein [Nocardia amikacinitolerans]
MSIADRNRRKEIRARLSVAAAIVVLAGAASGCGAQLEGRGVPGMAPVDLASLAVGPFPSAPVDYEPKLETKGDVFAIESRRLFGYLVAPYEVDSEMAALDTTRIVAAPGSAFSDSLGVLPAQFEPIAESNRLIAGVVTVRSNQKLRAMRNMSIALLRFPSDDAARSAATEFDRVMGELLPNRHALAIPGHPDAVASTANDQKGYVFATRGPMVVMAMTTVPQPDANALVTQLRTMLDLQLDRLTRFEPTPVDQILDLPANPDGIMRLALPPLPVSGDDTARRVQPAGIYDAAGQLHFEPRAAELKAVLASAGVDVVARNDATVYRTRDLDSAFRLRRALTEPREDEQSRDSPPGIADAQCLQRDTDAFDQYYEYICVLVHGRYVAVVGGDGLPGGLFDASLYQRAAAQYSILARGA